jgi:hypothetical protein
MEDDPAQKIEQVYTKMQVRAGQLTGDLENADPEEVALALGPNHIGLIRDVSGEYRAVPLIVKDDRHLDDFNKVLRERDRIRQIQEEIRLGHYTIDETGG